jgi:signal transduction histidine kinase
VTSRQPGDPALAAPVAVVVLGSAGLLFRNDRWPVPFVPLGALSTAGVAVLCGGRAGNIGWFTLCILAGWAAFQHGPRVGAGCLLGLIAVLVGEALFGTADPGWAAWIAGTCFSAGAAAAVDHERRLLAQLRAAQGGLAERSRAEERNRISRELHDVIAHTLTVSLLHVSSARLAVEHDPADAARALAEAERLGRESLDEVRAIVGLLRTDESAALSAPAPGASAVPELIERFRAAGVEVALSAEGLDGLPATVGVTLYRILQEALTNAARHAPGCAIAVHIATGDRRVELAVDSAGAPGGGRGMGLETMRERAEALGGGCEAGAADGGWRVRAWVPSR